MDKAKSLQLQRYITNLIINDAPYFNYTSQDLEKEKRLYSSTKLLELQDDGLYDGDFEKFFVINNFLNATFIKNYADKEYIRLLFQNAKKFSKQEFLQDEYLKAIKKVPTVKVGNLLLTNCEYSKGEFFQYDYPDFTQNLVVPKLGFFTDDISFPTIYEGNIPWMSICPSEIYSMKEQMEQAFGNVLVLGLGLGYYPFIISLKDSVKSITIIEIEPEIINLFNQYIFPYFPCKDKIKIIKADAISYLKTVKPTDFDFAFCDIWESQVDGAVHYKNIKPFEKLLPNTKFTYWIEDQIKYHIENEEK